MKRNNESVIAKCKLQNANCKLRVGKPSRQAGSLSNNSAIPAIFSLQFAIGNLQWLPSLTLLTLLLAMFEYAPADVRLRHVIAKENLVGRLLDSARANIHKPPTVFLRVAIEGFKGTLGFVQTDLPKAFSSVTDPKLQSEFKKSTKN